MAATAQPIVLASDNSPVKCDYSVIICTLNRAHLLRTCIEAILDEMARTDEQGELLLIDNGSTDNTRDTFMALCSKAPRHARVEYLYEARCGLSVARNLGVRCATGDILIFVDDDAIVGRGWLVSCMRAFAEHPAAAAIGGEILPRSVAPIPDWLRPPLTHVYSIISLGGDHIRPFPKRTLPIGANMAFRRSALVGRKFSEHLGRTGANLISQEEGEIFLAIRKRGDAILYVPAMRVEHIIDPERLTEDWAVRRSYFEGVSKARMRLGLRQFLIDMALHCVKLCWLCATVPLARSPFPRLVWRCRMNKSVGFFQEFFTRFAGLTVKTSEDR